MKDLEKENLRLRRANSDLTLDKLIPQEAARGNATVKCFHLRQARPAADAPRRLHGCHNCARRLETLNGLMPCEYIVEVWTSEPNRFIVAQIYQMPGLTPWP